MPVLETGQTCADAPNWTCSAVQGWTGSERAGKVVAWVVGTPLAIIGILVVAVVLRWLCFRVIDRVVARAVAGPAPSRFAGFGERAGAVLADADGTGTASGRRAQRARSLGSLLKSLTTALIFGIAGVMILSQVGVNVAPILASAGVLGLAIGFGAQSLVKDFISGIALMVEDQYGVGDSVNLGTVTGTVEAVGLRVTRLRDVDGTVWYVRNGEILQVGNQSQNWARTVLDISVGYGEDLSRVQRVLSEVAHEVYRDPAFSPVILEEPEVWGVQSLSPESVVVRLTLKTAPAEQWRIARALRERIKDRFDAEGITLRQAQRVIWQQAPGAGPQQQPPPPPADPATGG